MPSKQDRSTNSKQTKEREALKEKIRHLSEQVRQREREIEKLRSGRQSSDKSGSSKD